jgi:DNA processing protein
MRRPGGWVSNDSKYIIALHHVRGLGPIRLKLLLEYFSDPKIAWEAKKEAWQEIKVPPTVIDAWQQLKITLNIDELLKELEKSKISFVSLFDGGYPTLLKQIHNPPVVLYFKGEISIFNSLCLAVVGTRKVTGYGSLITQRFTSKLASSGLTIVSGLARGVDTVAHRSAVEIKGKTIAVLGGLNKIFPPENERLAKEIVDGGYGVICSEFLPDEPSLPGNFPARNRIISGLSKAVLVTEAAEDSGSLITAKEAIDQGREVFAIPGPITSDQSFGTASLIKQGARLVTSPEEILEELGLEGIKNLESRIKNQIELSEAEKRILEALALENKHIDDLCRSIGLPASVVSASLVKMEIYGLVKNMGAGIYLKVS